MRIFGKIKLGITSLLSTLIIVIGSAYVLYGITDITTKGKNIEEIIVSGALATLIGWIVSILYSEISFIHAFRSETYLDTKYAKSEILTKITPHIGKVGMFCNKKNQLEHEIRITSLLTKVELSLEDYKNGEYDKKDKHIKKVIKEIRKCYFEVYTYNGLVNGVDRPQFKKKKRASVEGYRAKKYTAKLLSSALTGIMFGYYGLMLAKEPNLGMVIYLGIQFAAFNANGLVQYMLTRSFVENTLRIQLVEDTNALYEFEGSLTQHPEWYIKNTKEVKQEIKEKVIEEISIPIINNVVSLDTVNQPLD